MLIDLEVIDASALPVEVAVSAISMAELAAGPHATADTDERARRQDRLQRAEAAFDPLPFDSARLRPSVRRGDGGRPEGAGRSCGGPAHCSHRDVDRPSALHT